MIRYYFVVIFITLGIITASSACNMNAKLPYVKTSPAAFEVVSVSLTIEGENVTQVSATIKNTGGTDGCYPGELLLNGVTVVSEEIQISSGAMEKLSYSCNIKRGQQNIISIDRFIIPVDKLFVLPISGKQVYVIGGDSMFNDIAPPVEIKELIPFVPECLPDDEKLIIHECVWLYDGVTWKWEISVPQSLARLYKNLPRIDLGSYLEYIKDISDDDFLSGLLNRLVETAREQGYSDFETIQFLIAFVQYLPYVSDNSLYGCDDYPKYPVETLADFGGDCEDSTILLAALLRIFGQDFIIVEYPDHVGIGVPGNQITYGSYWLYKGREFFYQETSTGGWKTGELPPRLLNFPALLYTIN